MPKLWMLLHLVELIIEVILLRKEVIMIILTCMLSLLRAIKAAEPFDAVILSKIARVELWFGPLASSAALQKLAGAFAVLCLCLQHHKESRFLDLHVRLLLSTASLSLYRLRGKISCEGVSYLGRGCTWLEVLENTASRLWSGETQLRTVVLNVQ